eukprot:SAG31_NODE_1601_length_7786_cov_33.553272_8_plen_83_part_00
MDQFIDVCVLCGCDYADSIRGIGPKKAFEMIKKYGTIEKLVDTLDKSKVCSALPAHAPHANAARLVNLERWFSRSVHCTGEL